MRRMSWLKLVGCAGLAACAALRAGAAEKPADADTAKWSATAAARFMDEREVWWQGWDHAKRDHGTFCLSCHTQAPYAMVRSMLREEMHEQEPSQAEKAMLANLEKRVRAWDTMLPFYDDATYGKGKEIESRNAVAVLNSIVLLSYDRFHVSELSKMALDHAWALQSKSGPDAGSWVWQNFHYAPWEGDESQYYWAALMAVAVGRAPENYVQSPAIVGNISALRTYLRTHMDQQPLVNKAATLWAAARMQGLLTPAQKQKLAMEIFAAQNLDGGWSLAKMGPWKRRDGTPQETKSDGYATGLVTLALEDNHMKSSYVTRALAWLGANQNAETGAWPGWSVNKERDPQTGVGKFMQDAATGYAVLALKAAEPQY